MSAQSFARVPGPIKEYVGVSCSTNKRITSVLAFLAFLALCLLRPSMVLVWSLPVALFHEGHIHLLRAQPPFYPLR